MTYCVALKLDEGLVCLSDTRTNSGIDSVNRYKKTFTWEAQDRAIVMMSAGNLSITQGVIDQIERNLRQAEQDGGKTLTPLNAPSLFPLAEMAGLKMRELVELHGPSMDKEGVSSGATMLVGGQIEGEPLRLFEVYSAGNFIECGADTPYFQIGEAKYGKPVIDFTVTHETGLAEAVRTALVSMSSTLHSNLSVGMPLDLSVIRTDAHRFAARRRIVETDETWQAINQGWADALRGALKALPSTEAWLEG